MLTCLAHRFQIAEQSASCGGDHDKRLLETQRSVLQICACDVSWLVSDRHSVFASFLNKDSFSWGHFPENLTVLCVLHISKSALFQI